MVSRKKIVIYHIIELKKSAANRRIQDAGMCLRMIGRGAILPCLVSIGKKSILRFPQE